VTPTLGYLLAILAITFIIDLTLRALPFKILEPLRDSRYVSDMAVWMPPGIMLILGVGLALTIPVKADRATLDHMEG